MIGGRVQGRFVDLACVLSCTCTRSHAGGVSRASHSHHHGLGIGATVAIIHGYFKAFFSLFALAKCLHFGFGVVERISPFATLIDFKLAVLPLTIAGTPSMGVIDIHIGFAELACSGALPIFRDSTQDFACHDRFVIRAIDSDHHCAAGSVCRGHGERFTQRLTHTQRLNLRVCIAKYIRPIATGIDAEFAMRTAHINLWVEDRLTLVQIRHIQLAAGAQNLVFLDYSSVIPRLARSDDGHIVGTSNRDRNDLGIRAAMPVIHRDRDGVLQAFALLEALDIGIAVVQHVSPLAIVVNDEGAKAAFAAVIDRPGMRVRCVHIRDGQLPLCGQNSVFLDAGGHITRHGGNVIGADHSDGQGARRAVARRIRHRIGVGFSQRLAHSQRLHGWQCVIQHIGVAAIGMKRNHTVLPLTRPHQHGAVLRCHALAQLVIHQHTALQAGDFVFSDPGSIGMGQRASIRDIFFRQSNAAQTFLQRRWHGCAWIFQPQWRHGFDDAGKAHKTAAAFAAAFAAAGQACSCGVELIKWILAGIDRCDDLVNFGAGWIGHHRLFGLRWLQQIRCQTDVLILAHDQRWLAIGLQLHTAARGCDDLCIRRDAHAFMDGAQIAISATNPGLAGELGNENGLSCHGDLPQSDKDPRACTDDPP